MVRKLALSLLLLSAALPALAATARSYDDALKKAGDKSPIVIFSYGADYDEVSKASYEALVKRRGIMGVAGKAVFLEMPVYQQPSEREKKATEKLLGGKQLPWGIGSYPSLAVVDGQGNLRGIVQGADMKDAATASKALKTMLDAFAEQQKLILAGERASGNRRSELFAQAADINLRMPKVLPSGQKATSAIAPSLGFDPYDLGAKLKDMTVSQATTLAREMVDKGHYSRRQKQEILAAYAGHLRRNGASPETLRPIYTEMRDLDPNSMYAAFAEESMRLWAPGAEGNGE